MECLRACCAWWWGHPVCCSTSGVSIALVALTAYAAFLTIVRFAYPPEVARSLVLAVELAAVVFGLVVMVYTGLLLQGTGGVAFWNSPLLPALLLLSSASSGAALVLVGAFCLRWSLVEAGVHRTPVLEEVLATAAPFLGEAGGRVLGIELLAFDGATYGFGGHDITKTARMVETA